MRLLLGMILGAALTVGGAYVSDTATKPAPGAEVATHGQLGRGGPQLRCVHRHGQGRLEQADEVTLSWRTVCPKPIPCRDRR